MEDIIIQHLLSTPSYFRQVFPFLKKEHFEKIEHRNIFTYIQDYYFEYKEIPSNREIVTIIKSQKDSDLKELIIKTFSSILKAKSDIKEQFLKDKTEEHIKAKELMDFLISSAEDIQKGEVDIPKALQSVTDISKVSLQDDLGLDFKDIKERIKYYKTKLKGVSTGLPSLDKVLGGGFRPKTLNVISSPSGVGKSLFGSSLGSGILLNNQNVLIITLEMSDYEYFKRVDANVLDVDINSFYHLDENVIMNKFNEIKDTVGRMKSVEYPAGRFSALQLENLLDTLKNTENFIPDIIVVDYLALMKSDRYSSIQNSNSYYTSVAEDLRAIAQASDIPILTFTQLIRGSVNTSDFTQDSISLAKGIYEASDTFFFLISNPDMKENGEIGVVCDKNRNTGITNKTIMLGIDYKKMRVTDEGSVDDDSSGFDMVEMDMTNQATDGIKDMDFGNFNF